AEERARQEAEAATAKLQAEAEAAQQKSESTASDDAVWEEAFKQNQDELNAMEIEIDGLAGGLKAIINPLRKSLPGMEEAAQRLFSLAGTHKLDPIMLESIDQRGVLQASGLRQQMQPVLTAQNVVKDKIAALEQMKRSLPPLPEKGSKEKLNPDQQQTWKNISRIENKLIKMDQRLTLELSSATDLLGKIESMHTGVTGYLPDLWQTYYFSVPSRFFDPVAWEGITERWEKTLQNMNLRMSIEFPRNPSAWKGVGLRFLNVLLLGCVVIFFVNRRMVRAEKKGTMPTAARSGILRSLLWQFTGLALVGASFGSQGELFRGLLVLGSILVIGGEMTLAWGMRCFILDKKMGLTPLWPMYLASSLGILISYPNLPGGILSLSWIAVGLVSLYILKELHARELPGIENNLLHVHRLTVWLSMAVAAIGWPRMAILVLILVDCLAVIRSSSSACSRSSSVPRTYGTVSNTPSAACSRDSSRPSSRPLLLLICAAWCPGHHNGGALLWHYLGTGVQVGSASFNMVHLILIVSVFYITRAAITASRSFLNRVASQSYKIDKTLIPPMQTGITYGLWTLFALFTLKALGFGLENLAVIAGGLSVGIGFGMQTIVQLRRASS
ncbi:MAG: mechanosensitive ion channel protein, partial [Bilophila wadsworthia]